MDIQPQNLENCHWVQAGPSPLKLVELDSFGAQLLRWETAKDEAQGGSCQGTGKAKMWTDTQSAKTGISIPSHIQGDTSVVKVFTPKTVTLNNGDSCEAGSWVVWTEIIGQTLHHRIGCVAEIVQIAGAADFVLVTQTIIGGAHVVQDAAAPANSE
ncbi:hypothetical protein B0H10DRAFT_1967828 [Mycena sp. CBHHK59/15]|nr:hypothetical protein B0H10DRAFT_1967828 [Mycena sp. CBHHK59/15]